MVLEYDCMSHAVRDNGSLVYSAAYHRPRSEYNGHRFADDIH